MSHIIIVSNRLPVSVSRTRTGLKVRPSVGGLATGMKSIYREMEGVWAGWPGIDSNSAGQEEQELIRRRLEQEQCHPIHIDKKDMEGYYYGFSNRTIWPLFHYFPQYTVYSQSNWEAYNRVNRKFAEAIIPLVRDDSRIWVHDYQLLLLPGMIRERFPGVTIGFFIHIPFPSYELFRLLPWRKEILTGMLGADLVGFHSFDYQRHFNSCVRRLFGFDYEMNQLNLGNRIIRTDSFPMGIDYQRFHDAAIRARRPVSGRKSGLRNQLEQFNKGSPGRKMILSIDRMDYSKGIPNRLEAFRVFLEKYPEHHGKVSLVMLTVPSRSKVDQYRLLKKEVDELVGRINGTFGDLNWTPIWYFYRSMPFEDLIQLYTHADVALITPIRDGMNLVAKEYLATRTESSGVLILSEMAGSAKEMSEAVLINPNHRDEMADAIACALKMPLAEQVERNLQIQKRLKRYHVEKWAAEFMHALELVRHLQQQYGSRKLDAPARNSLQRRFKSAGKKILFLDYNGTLVDQKSNGDYTAPDRGLYSLLDGFLRDDSVSLVLMSSRDRKRLEEWFGERQMTLFAEHGIWKKSGDGPWQSSGNLAADLWKDSIRPVLEAYVDRTPGSYTEEMNNVLSWHYGRADPDQGQIRSRELKDELAARVLNMGLQIMEGRKVIEIKPSYMNKGKAALAMLQEGDYDFILAVGDDWTDEAMFELLPEEAVTIRVGMKKTHAGYSCESYQDVRELLKQFIKH